MVHSTKYNRSTGLLFGLAFVYHHIPKCDFESVECLVVIQLLTWNDLSIPFQLITLQEIYGVFPSQNLIWIFILIIFGHLPLTKEQRELKFK
jgi:hypothetical protein